MKNIKRLYAIIAVIFALMVFMCVLLVKEKTRGRQLYAMHLSDAERIAYYKNKYNEEVATRRAVEADLNLLKKTHGQQLDSVADRFNIRIRNLQTALNAAIVSGGHQVVEVVTTDTVIQEVKVPVNSFKYKDKWISISGKIYNNNATIDWEYYDEIQFILHYKRQNMFKRKELYVSAVSTNPHARIVGLESMRVTNTKTRFGIGLMAGYGVSDTGLSPFIGAGVYYSIINF